MTRRLRSETETVLHAAQFPRLGSKKDDKPRPAKVKPKPIATSKSKPKPVATARAKTRPRPPPLREQQVDEEEEQGAEEGGWSADGVRLNKCLSGLSRRAADEAINEGRVTINGCAAPSGSRVFRGDVVRLDGALQPWEGVAEAKEQKPSQVLEMRNFVYVKYWKPVGVTCTSDPTDSSNIIKAGRFDLLPQRLFTVGRLDKDSTGLILLTSDGRVNNALLAPKAVKEKVYVVETNRPATEEQLSQLAAGVVITTTSQRQGKTKAQATLTAKTRPCGIRRLPAGNPQSRKIEFTLTEGRNRQIRKMVDTLGLRVVSLHRVSFCGVTLKGLAEGNWAELSESEMAVVNRALDKAGGGTGDKPMKVFDDPEE